MELLLLELCTRVDLQLMLDYLSTYSHEVRGGSRKNITIFIKECKEFHMFFWSCFNTDANSSVRYSRVKCNFLEIPFSFNGFFELCQNFFGLLLENVYFCDRE
jgi:hypothetical protein